MGTKNITITTEAYENLKAHKREDESFTDTILRLTEADKDVMKGFGMLAEDDGFPDSSERARADLDEALDERGERRDRSL
ncbi:hypothetical protein C482_09632 [Natrialba chahannaoensis JCM 10990]|uniref:Antitoxin n=1 Tax=Natrialba chahannaoensis JCM 10990 TaxID=1227492 RepID=M0AN22_9EURY|nr:antitoxin VapB family protein [Natrialba chahannaoensis]ELY99736.1 hypothetical protein C482_09632 [Natrialba chahannaoensis JCM 10990]